MSDDTKDNNRERIIFSRGEYDLYHELGNGGFGTVYQAIHRSTGTEVALKVLALQRQQNREYFQRFCDEARIVADCDHPYLPTLSPDMPSNPEKDFSFPMRLTDARFLDRINYDSGNLKDLVDSCRAIQLSLKALAYLHSHGIVHRDYKPAHVSLDGTLVDFGLSAIGDRTLVPINKAQLKRVHTIGDFSESGCILGTPYYTAPEVIEGENNHFESDIWSVGATLYEIFTGNRPFPGVVSHQIFNRILTGKLQHQPSHKNTLLQGTSRADKLVKKILVKNPQQRKITVTQIGEELEEIIHELEKKQEEMEEKRAKKKKEQETTISSS